MVREEKRKTQGRMDTILLRPFRFLCVRDAGRVPIASLVNHYLSKKPLK